MTIIGLTGGIASGKSTAAKYLANKGAHIIDADKLGHLAYEPGQPALAAIVAEFGADVLNEDGTVNRKVLGGKVFGDPNALKRLTDIVWPAIRDLAAAEIAEVHSADPQRNIVLEAAVLLEAGWQDLVDEIWATVVDRDVAIARASARDGVEPAAVEARIDAQLSNDERRAAAHRVIDNSGTEQDLEAQLQTLWSQLENT